MIQVDENGWINPTCPYCDCVMEFNYHRWTTSSLPDPDLNLYCRRCHYAVKIQYATTSDSLERTPTKITRYNRSVFDQEDEEE